MCAECTGAAGENWKSGFVSSKTGPEATVGSMAVYQESEIHGVQIGEYRLVRDSEVPEGVVYFKLLALQEAKK